MEPISSSAANGLVSAFESFSNGDAGRYEIRYRNTVYVLISEQVLKREGCDVSLEVRCMDEDNVMFKSMLVKGIDSVEAEHFLTISSGSMVITVAFDDIEPEPEPEPVPVPLPVQERNHLGPMAPLNIYNAHPRLFRR